MIYQLEDWKSYFLYKALNFFNELEKISPKSSFLTSLGTSNTSIHLNFAKFLINRGRFLAL